MEGTDMARTARSCSESGWYHVTLRGAGRRALFESDDDRRAFLEMADKMAAKDRVGIAAWALMDNHVHLVAHADLGNLKAGMHRLCTGYAVRFNRSNGHVGPVFQGRFASFPIESDAYLMEAVRYVHANCRDKGIADPSRYEWCSYPAYLAEAPLPWVQAVIDIFGGREAFASFHRETVELAVEESTRHRRQLNDDDARAIAADAFGDRFAETVPLLEPKEKTAALWRLYALGLSTRQIERLTGVGRAIVRKACAADPRSTI